MAISSISTSYMAAPSLMAPHKSLLRAQPSSLLLPRCGLEIAATDAKASRPRRGKVPPPVEEKIQKFPSFANLLENFDKPMLVEFYTTWCVPCQLLGSNLIKAARLTTKHVQFVRIDVDKNRGLAAKFGIKAVPTYVIFKDGKQVDRFEGAKTVEHYVNRLQRALKGKEGAKNVDVPAAIQSTLKAKEGAKDLDALVAIMRILKAKEGAKDLDALVAIMRILKAKGFKTVDARAAFQRALQKALKAKEGAKDLDALVAIMRILKAKEGAKDLDVLVAIMRILKAKEGAKTVDVPAAIQSSLEDKEGAKTVDVPAAFQSSLELKEGEHQDGVDDGEAIRMALEAKEEI